MQASWLGFAGTAGYRTRSSRGRGRSSSAEAAPAAAATSGGSTAAGKKLPAGSTGSVEAGRGVGSGAAAAAASLSASGAPVDASVVDPIIAPPEHIHAMFTERLLYLPSSYQPQDPDQSMAGARPVFSCGDAPCNAAGRKGQGQEKGQENEQGQGQVATTTSGSAALEQGPSQGSRPSYRSLRLRLQREEGLVWEHVRAIPSADGAPSNTQGAEDAAASASASDDGHDDSILVVEGEVDAAGEREGVADATESQRLSHADYSPQAPNEAEAGTDSRVAPSIVRPAGSPVVFVTFNRWAKIDPITWQAWMGVLRRTPHALLWVYGGYRHTCRWGDGSDAFVVTADGRQGGAQSASNSSNTATSSGTSSSSGHAGSKSGPSRVGKHAALCGGALVTNASDVGHMTALWAEAAAAGIHPSRIIVAGRSPRASHLYRHYAADIMLDSRLYGAHTTAADGFFTGLPIVTMPGASFASRVGASLAAGMGSDRQGEGLAVDGKRLFGEGNNGVMADRGVDHGALNNAAHSDGSAASHASRQDSSLASLQITDSLSTYEDVAARLGSLSERAREVLRWSLHAAVEAVCALRGSACGQPPVSPAVVTDSTGSSTNVHAQAGYPDSGAPLVQASPPSSAPWRGLFDADGFADGMETLARAAVEDASLADLRGRLGRQTMGRPEGSAQAGGTGSPHAAARSGIIVAVQA